MMEGGRESLKRSLASRWSAGVVATWRGEEGSRLMNKGEVIDRLI